MAAKAPQRISPSCGMRRTAAGPRSWGQVDRPHAVPPWCRLVAVSRAASAVLSITLPVPALWGTMEPCSVSALLRRSAVALGCVRFLAGRPLFSRRQVGEQAGVRTTTLVARPGVPPSNCDSRAFAAVVCRAIREEDQARRTRFSCFSSTSACTSFSTPEESPGPGVLHRLGSGSGLPTSTRRAG